MIKNIKELRNWFYENQIAIAEKALQKRGFNVFVANNKDEVTEMMFRMISPEESIGSGSSLTLEDLGIVNLLENRGNPVIAKPEELPSEERTKRRRKALLSDVFITSVNAISLDGHLVSIDGTGNRVASTFFGPKRVFIISGANKIVKNLEMAIERARDVAIINCERLNKNTPCREKMKCCDCRGPKRICNILMIMEGKPFSTEINIILIKDELGL
jgi:L-lactate utilization protein LutB